MKNTKPTIPSLKHFYTKKLAYEEFFKLAPPPAGEKKVVCSFEHKYMVTVPYCLLPYCPLGCNMAECNVQGYPFICFVCPLFSSRGHVFH